MPVFISLTFHRTIRNVTNLKLVVRNVRKNPTRGAVKNFLLKILPTLHLQIKLVERKEFPKFPVLSTILNIVYWINFSGRSVEEISHSEDSELLMEIEHGLLSRLELGELLT